MKSTPPDIGYNKNPTIKNLKIGNRIEIESLLDIQIYPGTIHSTNFVRHQILYEDGDRESVKLSTEIWRLHHSKLSNLSVFSGPSLVSNEQMVLLNIMDAIGNKFFMCHHSEGYQKTVLIKAYEKEVRELKKTLPVIPRSALHKN